MDTDKLKEDCRTLLRNSDIKPHTKQGKQTIYAFWVGALQATPEDKRPPFVMLCLMSGRTDELI